MLWFAASIAFSTAFALILCACLPRRENSSRAIARFIEKRNRKPVDYLPRDLAELNDIYTASIANGALNMPLHDGVSNR